MAFIQSGQSWQFSRESDLEEVVWRNLPKLLNLRPLKRQFSISSKFCDILAVDDCNQLVIIELKNTEDRYVVQQLVRYYDAIKTAEILPFEVVVTEPRLVAIAPSFHADTLTDCRYCTLKIALITFELKPSPRSRLRLVLNDAAGDELSSLLLPNQPQSPQPDVLIPEPPSKLLNWLSHSSLEERNWVMQMRSQILSFDPRMKEVVTSTSLFYGCGKTKACCELRKVGSVGFVGRAIAYFLWLPHPDYRAHVVRMMVGFDFKPAQITGLIYSRYSYRTSKSWNFPDRANLMAVMCSRPRFKEALV